MTAAIPNKMRPETAWLSVRPGVPGMKGPMTSLASMPARSSSWPRGLPATLGRVTSPRSDLHTGLPKPVDYLRPVSRKQDAPTYAVHGGIPQPQAWQQCRQPRCRSRPRDCGREHSGDVPNCWRLERNGRSEQTTELCHQWLHTHQQHRKDSLTITNKRGRTAREVRSGQHACENERSTFDNESIWLLFGGQKVVRHLAAQDPCTGQRPSREAATKDSNGPTHTRRTLRGRRGKVPVSEENRGTEISAGNMLLGSEGTRPLSTGAQEVMRAAEHCRRQNHVPYVLD